MMTMTTPKHHKVAAMALLLLLLLLSIANNPATKANAQALCYSQFMLANEACSFLRQAEELSHGTEQQKQAGLVSSGGSINNPVDSPCCRRLTGIDNACVCGVLSRLPIFITRPQHVITLTPANGCEVSFQCDGRS
ncbi:Bifunctional inhibitor/lipid-transfer protein/seed storage 2S albumin protein [Dioscorea alata]|uniref:Bifunctional inhibitor/lipid-transfer protein/seed storage 2S albumin protein n=1 Tax=Dioscorea alata TaxID=55571 RepID=A0ACB7TT51_DIOAL|nr:Bifunctional inhibitor/lipid-transfer protein/seed storage 2S albumin protein [Dioscorea alata]